MKRKSLVPKEPVLSLHPFVVVVGSLSVSWLLVVLPCVHVSVTPVLLWSARLVDQWLLEGWRGWKSPGGCGWDVLSSQCRLLPSWTFSRPHLYFSPRDSTSRRTDPTLFPTRVRIYHFRLEETGLQERTGRDLGSILVRNRRETGRGRGVGDLSLYVFPLSGVSFTYKYVSFLFIDL